MSVKELQLVGKKLEIEDPKASTTDDLVDQILQAQTERAGLDYVFGILDIVDEGYGFMRRHGLLPSRGRRLRQLQPGAPVRPAHRRPGRGRRARTARGREVLRPDPGRHRQRRRHRDVARRRPFFADLTPIHPIELINLETDPKNLSQRLVNLVNPLGKGQRALIVSPPKAGKTMLLKSIANGISANYPDILLMVALIGERPEEVTDMRRSASRARSSAPPSTSRPRTTRTSRRWPSRSPSARSRPAATS